MLQKIRAIVLHTLKYGDSSLVVHVYSQEVGRKTLWVRIPKSSKARAKMQQFQPLSVLDLDIEMRGNSSMAYVKEARWGLIWQSIPFHPIKSSIALFLAELLGKVLMEEVGNGPLFAYVQGALQWLDNNERPAANFHLVFMMHLTLFLGLYPNLDNYHDGDWFDLQNGTFCSTIPQHKQCVKPAETSRMCTLLRMNFENMHLFTLSREERGQILDALLTYYAIHITGSSDLKSLPVLKELFA